MDIGSLLTGTKWEIIELISQQPRSPLEISKKLHTSIANISQQIRLLETAGLVKKEKLNSRRAGKPRTLFSLSNDYAFITIIAEGMSKKRLIRISQKQKEVLKNIIR